MHGTMLAAEKTDDGTAINLGIMEQARIIDTARMVLGHSGWNADVRLCLGMPTGLLNRATDNSRWKPPGLETASAFPPRLEMADRMVVCQWGSGASEKNPRPHSDRASRDAGNNRENYTFACAEDQLSGGSAPDHRSVSGLVGRERDHKDRSCLGLGVNGGASTRKPSSVEDTAASGVVLAVSGFGDGEPVNPASDLEFSIREPNECAVRSAVFTDPTRQDKTPTRRSTFRAGRTNRSDDPAADGPPSTVIEDGFVAAMRRPRYR